MPTTQPQRLFVVPPEEPEPLMTPVQVANWLGICWGPPLGRAGWQG